MNKKPCINISWILPFLKIISDENRLKIICFLRKWEKSVNEITNFLEISQNLSSHHLKVLKKANIVSSRKEWLNIKYSINNENINQYLEYFNDLFK